MRVHHEYPKYIALADGYKIVDNREQEDEVLASIKPEEESKDESASESNGEGSDSEGPRPGRRIGAGRKSS